MRYSIIYVHEDIMEVKKKKANTIGFEFNLTMRFLSITTRTKPEFYYHHRNEITENQVKQQHQPGAEPRGGRQGPWPLPRLRECVCLYI